MPTLAQIEAAAKALWEEASHREFGYWENQAGKWQDAWRKSAQAALAAAEAAEWQPIASEPSDDSDIWLSDGKSVWGPGKAHRDGSLKLPSRYSCKFWCPAHIPLPPPPAAKEKE